MGSLIYSTTYTGDNKGLDETPTVTCSGTGITAPGGTYTYTLGATFYRWDSNYLNKEYTVTCTIGGTLTVSLTIPTTSSRIDVSPSGSVTSDTWLGSDNSLTVSFSGSRANALAHDGYVEVEITYTDPDPGGGGGEGGDTPVEPDDPTPEEPEEESHRTIMYRIGNSWVECEVYYQTGSGWQLCEPYYHNGNAWV